MKSHKFNFTIPEETARRLFESVPDRKRSAFVAQAIADKLNEAERQRLIQTLAEGYKARSLEDAQINEEWESATLEGWG
jgi:hypothetical protein